MKDVEAVRPAEIRLAAIRPRVFVEDKLIGADLDRRTEEGRGGRNLVAAPCGPAARRAARPRESSPLRGNVDTRLKKLEAGDVEATILSAAGLHRLGMDDIGTAIPLDVMLPAPGQGALGIECRADDSDCMQLLKLLDDSGSRAAVMAERAFARALGGSCHSPVAALGTVEKAQVRFTCEILSADGAERVRDEATFATGREDVPEQLARDMLERAPQAIRNLFQAA